MGLEFSVGRLRTALVEFGQAEKPATARLPLSVQRNGPFNIRLVNTGLVSKMGHLIVFSSVLHQRALVCV